MQPDKENKSVMKKHLKNETDDLVETQEVFNSDDISFDQIKLKSSVETDAFNMIEDGLHKTNIGIMRAISRISKVHNPDNFHHMITEMSPFTAPFLDGMKLYCKIPCLSYQMPCTIKFEYKNSTGNLNVYASMKYFEPDPDFCEFSTSGRPKQLLIQSNDNKKRSKRREPLYFEDNQIYLTLQSPANLTVQVSVEFNRWKPETKEIYPTKLGPEL